MRFLRGSGGLRANSHIRIAHYLINRGRNEVIRRHANSNCALRLSAQRLVTLVVRSLTRSCDLRDFSNALLTVFYTSNEVMRRQRLCVLCTHNL